MEIKRGRKRVSIRELVLQQKPKAIVRRCVKGNYINYGFWWDRYNEDLPDFSGTGPEWLWNQAWQILQQREPPAEIEAAMKGDGNAG